MGEERCCGEWGKQGEKRQWHTGSECVIEQGLCGCVGRSGRSQTGLVLCVIVVVLVCEVGVRLV